MSRTRIVVLVENRIGKRVSRLRHPLPPLVRRPQSPTRRPDHRRLDRRRPPPDQPRLIRQQDRDQIDPNRNQDTHRRTTKTILNLTTLLLRQQQLVPLQKVAAREILKSLVSIRTQPSLVVLIVARRPRIVDDESAARPSRPTRLHLAIRAQSRRPRTSQFDPRLYRRRQQLRRKLRPSSKQNLSMAKNKHM